MTTKEIDDVLKVLDSIPTETELVVTGGADPMEVLYAEIRRLYVSLNAVIDMSPTKEVYSLLKLEYYRTYLSKFNATTSENVA